MEYRVNIHKNAQKHLEALDNKTRSRLIEGLRLLKSDPLSHNVKKLKGTKGPG
jgi:mRNA-degrading endonuclease RelE of RelBE toxin-antitoxin system